MNTAQTLCLAGAGVFFLTALLTGCWKYHQMLTSPDGKAHVYVDTAHRAALLYAFAATMLERFAGLSAWPAWVNTSAVIALLGYFALAIGSYALHGALRDTENQMHPATGLTRAAMATLMLAEISGFLVLFSGFLRGRF